MEKILFEKEVLESLKLPSVPRKKWNGEDSFKEGVAVTVLQSGSSAYAVATFDAEADEKPRIKKVFTLEPFFSIKEIFVVPAYMDSVDDVDDRDLDKESKEAALRLAEEAQELEEEGVESDEMKEMKELPEWVFDNVHNAEEAAAFIKNFNKQNNIHGSRLPQDEEGLKLRLLTIYEEMKKKTSNENDEE
jgi:hypothetical protein